MKKKIAQFVTKFGGTMAAFAMVVAVLTANSTCFWLSYQPEEPDEIKQLKKF
jgi:cyclic lactone autoinducer peptide